jgi:hypothetical protein
MSVASVLKAYQIGVAGNCGCRPTPTDDSERISPWALQRLAAALMETALLVAGNPAGPGAINLHEVRWCDSFPRDGACKLRGCGARKEESDLDNLVAEGGFKSHPPR